LDKAFYDTVFLLLGRGVFLGVESTCVGGVDEAMNENDQLDGQGSGPVSVVDPLLGRFVVIAGALGVFGLDVRVTCLAIGLRIASFEERLAVG